MAADRVEINEEGLGELQADLAEKLKAAVAKGEAAAHGDGPDEVAASVASELRTLGVEVNEDALRAEYRARV